MHPCVTPTCPIRSSVLYSSATGNAFTARPAPHTAIQCLYIEGVAHSTYGSFRCRRAISGRGAAENRGWHFEVFLRNCISSNAIRKNCQDRPCTPPPFPTSASLPRSKSNDTRNLGYARERPAGQSRTLTFSGSFAHLIDITAELVPSKRNQAIRSSVFSQKRHKIRCYHEVRDSPCEDPAAHQHKSVV